MELHPVSDEMRLRIKKELKLIEIERNVTILYACESGSRGWGFASEDSDYDVRFIYVEKPYFHLGVETGRDVIEKPIDALLDISGWSLKKTLGLLWKSNPAIFEWLDSPIKYVETEYFKELFPPLANKFFNPNAAYNHYNSLLAGTVKRHLTAPDVRLKKYFYALRPLLAARWLKVNGTMPPMEFEKLCNQPMEEYLHMVINKFLDIKRVSTETKYIRSDLELDNIFNTHLALAIPEFPTPQREMETLNVHHRFFVNLCK